jgi:protein SCO1
MLKRSLPLFWIACVLVAPLRAHAQDLPAPDVGITQRLNEQVPLDAVFRDESNRLVKLGDYVHGKPVILTLVYYRCPRLCSLVLNHLTESMRKLDYRIGKEFEVVTVSFDPRETSELARVKKDAYLEAYGHAEAERGWHFLTGEEASIKQLAEAVGFRYSYDPQRDQFAHASAVMILTSEGKIARYLFGLDYPSRDLRFSLEDASQNKIGSPIAQPIRLLCFAYDPHTGRYSFLVMRFVQGAAIFTLALLGMGYWRLTRKNAKRRAAQALDLRPG